MDTAKDARILLLEDALRRLNEMVGNRKFKFHIDYSKLNAELQQAGSLIYEVKYSYVPGEKVAELEATSKIVRSFESFKQTLDEAVRSTGFKPKTANETLTLAEADYCFRVAASFPARLEEANDDPALAVDILAVEVSQTQPVLDSKNLTECRCTDGSRIWRIITNIQDVKTGAKLACAVLPPVDMMGIVSEAMFLGGESLPDDTDLGPLKNPSKSVLDQSRAQVLQVIKRMM